MRRRLFLLAYEGFWCGIRWILLPLLWLFQEQMRGQIKGRRFARATLELWREARSGKAGCAIFFCSSAGEYEQAKPLARRLHVDYDYFVLFLFASESGHRFAQAQGENLSYHKAPWDSPLAWRSLREALQPTLLVVVRYELWPGFLSVAAARAPLYLIDAVQSAGLREQKLGRWIWQRLLVSFQHVFTVGPADAVFYQDVLNFPRAKISVVGDSKYDRVLERIAERESRAVALRQQLSRFRGEARLLVLGSAWPDDLDLILAVFSHLPHLDAGQSFKIVVAPHDVSPLMGQLMESKLKAAGLTVCRVTRDGLDAVNEKHDALLVDEVGFLAELYACADLAWIGGALHHRVHNVLEAACRGIYLGFGPRYTSSQEAIWLVEQRLAQVAETSDQLLAWISQLSWEHQPPHLALWEAVIGQRGASDRMVQVMLART